MKTIKIWILMMIFLGGGLIGNIQVAKADPLNACNNFYEGVVDCSDVDPTGCHSCTHVGTTVTSIENAHWWCHKHYSDCSYSMLGSCTSAAAGVRHSFCGRYEGCAYTGGSCVGGAYTNADTLYEISCECSSPAACNPSGGVCSSENTVDVTDCVACNASGYQYSSGCRTFGIGCNINSGSTSFCECGGIFPPCWSICDDTPGGCCSNAGKICVDTTGDGTKETCMLPASLVLTATASPNSVALNGTSIIYFKVTLDGAPVAGATIHGITLLGGSVANGIVLNDCLTQNTDATGRCTVFYTNPNVAGSFNISATHASHGTDPDSGPANVLINVSGCPVMVPQTWGCGASHPACGPGIAPDPPALDPVICTTSAGVSVRHTFFSGGSYTCSAGICTSVDFTCPAGCNAACDDCAGACVPGTCNGCDWCDGSFSPAVLRSCVDGTGALVAGAPGCCAACAGGGGGGGCTTVWGGWTACAGAPGTETRSDSNSCVGDQSRSCCDNNGHCVLPKPICEPLAGVAGVCVECLTNPDCDVKGPGYVCDNKVCVPCSGEGEAAAGPHLCCEGLNWLNGICTSACDPNSWFFCNPLRTNVEELAEGGERIIGYVLGLIGSVVLLLIVISGAMYMTSAGSEERIASSKKVLTAAVIGLAIALLAYSLLLVIMTVLGM